MRLFNQYYIPKYKYQIVELLGKAYPKDKGEFWKMSREQLLAIYCHYRERDYETERKANSMDSLEKGTSDNSPKIKPISIPG